MNDVCECIVIRLLCEHNQDFMAHPQSGMKASRIVLRLSSSTGSNLPSFLILAKRAACPPLRWSTNFD